HDAVVDVDVLAEGPRTPQHRVDEGGLAVVDVGDDRDVAQVGAHGHGSTRFRWGWRRQGSGRRSSLHAGAQEPEAPPSLKPPQLSALAEARVPAWVLRHVVVSPGKRLRIRRTMPPRHARRLLREQAVPGLAAQPLLGGVGYGDRGEEALRVGVLGGPEDLLARAELDDLAAVHDGDAPREHLDDREVVRDEDAREAVLALQLGEQLEDLGLDRDVERRGQLVRDEELGAQGERTGDAHALALTARELVRVTVAHQSRQVHLVEELLDALLQLRALGDLLQQERLADRLAHGQARVERGARVLEDDRHVLPHLAQVRG